MQLIFQFLCRRDPALGPTCVRKWQHLSSENNNRFRCRPRNRARLTSSCPQLKQGETPEPLGRPSRTSLIGSCRRSRNGSRQPHCASCSDAGPELTRVRLKQAVQTHQQSRRIHFGWTGGVLHCQSNFGVEGLPCEYNCVEGLGNWGLQVQVSDRRCWLRP